MHNAMTISSVNKIGKIKKQHIEATISFAIDNIPGVDETTLEKFLELLNATGNFGSITEEEFIEKMRIFRKYVPGFCDYSLLTLVELLNIQPSQVRRNGSAAIASKSLIYYWSVQTGHRATFSPVEAHSVES